MTSSGAASTFSDVYVYYLFKSKKNGILPDVVIRVNGQEVQYDGIFYEVILPFLPMKYAEAPDRYIHSTL